MRVLTLPVISGFLILNAACSGSVNDGELKLIALDNAYVEGWKLDGSEAQEAAIMSLLTDDALIMPGLGTEPRRGAKAIREFWFPEGAPSTIIIEFQHNPTDVVMDGDIGIINGRYILKFEYGSVTYNQEGNYLTVARRQNNGDWLASKLIWNDRRIED